MSAPVPVAGVEPSPLGAAGGGLLGEGDGDVPDSGVASPTARPCPASLCRPMVAGMIRKAPSAARITTTAAKISFRWADVRSIAVRYFRRRSGRSQNGPAGSSLRLSLRAAPAPAAPAHGAEA